MKNKYFCLSVLLLLLFFSAAAYAAECNITTTGHFSVDANGDIADSRTGLTWKRCLAGQSFSNGSCNSSATNSTWDNALKLPLSGWRIPNIKELQSIVDETKYNPAINADCFPTSVGNVYIWSSSLDAANAANAWLVDFKDGLLYNIFPRNGQQGITVSVRFVKDTQ